MEKFLKWLAIIGGPLVIIFYAMEIFREPRVLFLFGKVLLLGFGVLFAIALIRILYVFILRKVRDKHS